MVSSTSRAFHRVAPRLLRRRPERVWRLVIPESLRLGDTPPQALPRRVGNWVAGVRAARTRGARVYGTVEAAARRIRHHDPLCPEAEARFLAERGTRAVVRRRRVRARSAAARSRRGCAIASRRSFMRKWP